MIFFGKKKQDSKFKKFAAILIESINESKMNKDIQEKFDSILGKDFSDFDVLTLLNEEELNDLTKKIVKEITDKIQENIIKGLEKDIKEKIEEEKEKTYGKSKREKEPPSYEPRPFVYDNPMYYPNFHGFNLHNACLQNDLTNTEIQKTFFIKNPYETPLFEIVNLTASINDLIILKNFNLKIYHGETHVIMGRNGSGKSTLSKVIAGHPAYKVISGDILFEGKSILNLEAEERSHLGIFLAFQYPTEIPGVSNEDFLRLAYNTKLKNKNQPEVDPIKFLEIINNKLKIVQMDSAFLARNINEGFSGGEKKRNEILQMALLDPKLSILDEADSGLDIDALKIVANGMNNLMNNNKAMIIITHYQRLLDYVKPDYIHIIQNGTIIKTGDSSLAIQLEANGYEGY